jgi:hypothetical protein
MKEEEAIRIAIRMLAWLSSSGNTFAALTS